MFSQSYVRSTGERCPARLVGTNPDGSYWVEYRVGEQWRYNPQVPIHRHLQEGVPSPASEMVRSEEESEDDGKGKEVVCDEEGSEVEGKGKEVVCGEEGSQDEGKKNEVKPKHVKTLFWKKPKRVVGKTHKRQLLSKAATNAERAKVGAFVSQWYDGSNWSIWGG